jgi:hypothetical protein
LLNQIMQDRAAGSGDASVAAGVNILENFHRKWARTVLESRNAMAERTSTQ